MTTLDAFWTGIDEQLERAATITTAQGVVNLLNEYGPPSSGDAFFAGGGGDEDLWPALRKAGWTVAWMEADYYWGMQAPDGSGLHYVEGDVYLGVGRPLPHGEPVAAVEGEQA